MFNFSPTKRFYVLLVKTLISAGLLLFLIYSLNFTILFHTLENSNILFVLFAGMLYMPLVYLSTLKWSRFLHQRSEAIPFSTLIQAYLMGSFFNNFLPTSIGGDAYRLVYLNKHYPNYKNIFKSIFYERFTGLFVVCIINVLLFLIYILTSLSNSKTFVLVCLISFLFSLSIILTFFLRNILSETPILKWFFLKKVKGISAFDLLDSSANPPKLFLFALGYSLVFNLIVTFGTLIYFKAFGLEVNFLYLFFVSTITQIFSILPFSLNSIGVTEGLFVYLLNFVGVSPELSFIVALLNRVFVSLLSLSGGIIYLRNTVKEFSK